MDTDEESSNLAFYALQNLYQYALAFSDIEGRFLIYTMSPQSAVPCSELLLVDGRFGHVFAVEEDNDGIDSAALFGFDKPSDSNSLVSNESPEGNMAQINWEAVYPSNLGEFMCPLLPFTQLWLYAYNYKVN